MVAIFKNIRIIRGECPRSLSETLLLRRGWWYLDATTAGAMFHSGYLLRRQAVLKVILTFNTAPSFDKQEFL